MITSASVTCAVKYSMLGDIIGFGNGDIEFNKSLGNDNLIFDKNNYGEKYIDIGADYSNQLVFDFLYNGGFSKFPKKGWRYSDDTVMTFANIFAISQWEKAGHKDIDNLLGEIKSEYIKIVGDNQSLNNFETKQMGGLTTIRNLKKLRAGDDYNHFPYDNSAGGSGGTMRSGIIGTYFNKPEQQLKLIEVVIESVCMTHPNAIAFLGSIMIALFCSYAVQRMKPEKWCLEAIMVIEDNIIDNYIKEKKPDYFQYYERDKKLFLNKWKDYFEEKISDNTLKYNKSLIMKFPAERTKYYNKYSARKTSLYPGAGGDDSVIIAYDCLLDCDGSFEKMVTYACLHVGDSDTTGSIGCLLYGLVYGTSEIAEIMLKNIDDDDATVLNMVLSKLWKI